MWTMWWATPDKWKEKRLRDIKKIKLYQDRDPNLQETLCNAACMVLAGDEEIMEASPRLTTQNI